MSYANGFLFRNTAVDSNKLLAGPIILGTNKIIDLPTPTDSMNLQLKTIWIILVNARGSLMVVIINVR